MLGLVIRKQVLEYLLSSRFLVATILCLLTGLATTAIRLQDYRESLSIYRVNREEHGNEARSYIHPFPVTYGGVSIDKKPSVLQVFYQGLATPHPLTVRVTANRNPAVESQFGQTNPVSSLFQTVDLISFTTVIVSLLALVFSYDLVSGEKETGTLRLTLSFPLPRYLLVIGKWIGGYLALVLPYLVTASCCLCLAVLYPGTEIESDDVLTSALVVGLSMLYVGSIYGLGLLVSVFTSRSLTSITILLALWVVWTIGIPTYAPYIGRALLPLSTVQELERQKWAIGEEEMAIRSQKNRAYRQSTNDSQLERSKMNTEFWRQAFRAIAEREVQVLAEYQRILDRQTGVAMWLSRLSPAASFTYAVGELANTGMHDLRRFQSSLHGYRLGYLDYAEDKWFEWVQANQLDISTEDYPRFYYFTAELNVRIQNMLLDLGLLAGWNMLLFVSACVAFLKYDVR